MPSFLCHACHASYTAAPTPDSPEGHLRCPACASDFVQQIAAEDDVRASGMDLDDGEDLEIELDLGMALGMGMGMGMPFAFSSRRSGPASSSAADHRRPSNERPQPTIVAPDDPPDNEDGDENDQRPRGIAFGNASGTEQRRSGMATRSRSRSGAAQAGGVEGEAGQLGRRRRRRSSNHHPLLPSAGVEEAQAQAEGGEEETERAEEEGEASGMDEEEAWSDEGLAVYERSTNDEVLDFMNMLFAASSSSSASDWPPSNPRHRRPSEGESSAVGPSGEEGSRPRTRERPPHLRAQGTALSSILRSLFEDFQGTHEPSSILRSTAPTPRPASNYLINSQRKYTIEEGQSPEESECPICTDPYEPGQAVLELSPCGHAFHESCSKEWLTMNATCPICRVKIERPRPTDRSPLRRASAPLPEGSHSPSGRLTSPDSNLSAEHLSTSPRSIPQPSQSTDPQPPPQSSSLPSSSSLSGQSPST